MSRIKDVIGDILKLIWGPNIEPPKRARNSRGRFIADDKSTKDVNEAWVGGKAPIKKKN